MKAFKVTAKAWFPHYESIRAAETRGKAKYSMSSEVSQAGYQISWLAIRAIRAPEFDHLAQDQLLTTTLGWRDDGDFGGGCLLENKKEVARKSTWRYG